MQAYQNNKAQKLSSMLAQEQVNTLLKRGAHIALLKAALDMFTQVLKAEHPDFKVFSVAPGIVDTPMQDNYPKCNETAFSPFRSFSEL